MSIADTIVLPQAINIWNNLDVSLRRLAGVWLWRQATLSLARVSIRVGSDDQSIGAVERAQPVTQRRTTHPRTQFNANAEKNVAPNT